MSGQHLHNRPDPHSYYREGQPEIRHITWSADVDFETRMLTCTVVLKFDAEGPVDLDTRDLTITRVGVEEERNSLSPPIAYTLGKPDPILGTRLSFIVPSSRAVCIAYSTSPESAAIQWLTPEQTAGKRYPMVYSHAGAINARAMLPCQDTPLVRFQYSADLCVPYALRGLMAASSDGTLPPSGGNLSVVTTRWTQHQPIPSYCFAFIVGKFESRDISPRCAVWGEREVIDAAVDEFRDLPRMLEEAEKIFGEYPWPRCDVLVMPPAFPYGGMEQPERAVVSSTIITGDRSLVSVVAHELAHGWFGNCVTATHEHLWLVEGFACYAEQRILEAMYGRDFAEMRASLRYREMERDIAALMQTHPTLTRLRMDLAGLDPEIGATHVSYMKGYLLLRRIEEQVGRDAFEMLLRQFLAEYQWPHATSVDFLDFASVNLPEGTIEAVFAWDYIYEAGLPPDAPKPQSKQLESLTDFAARCEEPSLAFALIGMTTLAWALYLSAIPRDAREFCETLNAKHGLTESHRAAEVHWAWYLLALESGAAYDRVALATFLGSIGRMRYLTPIYRLLARNPATAAWAREVYDRCKPGYHPTARREIERTLMEHPSPA